MFPAVCVSKRGGIFFLKARDSRVEGIAGAMNEHILAKGLNPLEGASSGKTPEILDLPLVSVIVICYNHAPFLEKCINSIQQQTYDRLELIVVENLSTDNSREVIEALPEGRFPLKPIFSTYNGREMGAMTQGFAAATGRYICFVDGDDWLLPHCIETHIAAHLISRIAVGVTSVDMYQSYGDDIVVGTGKRVSKFVMSKRGEQPDLCRMENLLPFRAEKSEWDLRPQDLHYVPPSMGHEWHWSPTSGLCFRRELLQLLFTPYPELRDGADGYLVRGTCCLTGGITIDRSLAVYRMHGNNLFATHPALENLLQFKRDHNADLDTAICSAVVRCFREQMADLSQKLEVPDIFIEAIHSMSRVALSRNSGPYTSYTVRFLLENKADISKCFGGDTYRWWLRKYMRIPDYARMVLDRVS